MTLMDNEKEFPDWDTYYKENDIEKMPWFSKELDLDVKNQIESKNLTVGKFLDLGTGPGTQAMQLARLGFVATGADISENAVRLAQGKFPNARYVADDILESKLPDCEFDYILDRGCFHVFEPEKRAVYLSQIKRILKQNGTLFLKIMSIEETALPEDKGPYKFSEDQIREIFGGDFEIESISKTVYYGTLDPLPKALFAVMKKL